MYFPPAIRPIIGSPFSLYLTSEFIDARSVSGSASFWSLLFTRDKKPGVPGVLLGAVLAAVLAAVSAAVCDTVLYAVVPANEALRGVAIEPVRGVMGLLLGAVRATPPTLYEELALDAANDPGLDGRA
jgi:hypothetical protein